MTREPLNLLVDGDELTPKERDDFAGTGTRSFLMVPLVIGDESLGVLNLYSRQPARFSTSDVRLARELATQVALAIDRARLHEAVRERADTDGLTGVLNHRAVLEALDRELARARRHDVPLAVMMVDLDGFKRVNDTWGHQIGDQALLHVAALLRSSVRESDHVGRYGGDEFLMVLPDTGADGARQIASRLLDRAEAVTLLVSGVHLPILLSAGIACYPEDGITRRELLECADTRMYQSKSARGWIALGS
jgi:diguanylate cyclase (GGDEF)-like protein